jgi:methionine synthase II (cobalamin-independent)
LVEARGELARTWDATTACIKDQELAGLDIVTDGQMQFDDPAVASAGSSG